MFDIYNYLQLFVILYLYYCTLINHHVIISAIFHLTFYLGTEVTVNYLFMRYRLAELQQIWRISTNILLNNLTHLFANACINQTTRVGNLLRCERIEREKTYRRLMLWWLPFLSNWRRTDVACQRVQYVTVAKQAIRRIGYNEIGGVTDNVNITAC